MYSAKNSFSRSKRFFGDFSAAYLLNLPFYNIGPMEWIAENDAANIFRSGVFSQKLAVFEKKWSYECG